MKQKTPTSETNEMTQEVVLGNQVGHDLKNAILIVSIVVNLVVLITWILLQLTSQYDNQMASLLFG